MQTLPHTILIIDDEPKIRKSLAQVLENEGYQVITAASGNEALECIRANLVNLILLDLKLPDFHGMDLLTRIRESEPDIPVFIFTANASLETAVEAVRKGARDYLLKPVNPEVLIERLNEILSEQAQPTRRREIVDQIQNLLSELATSRHVSGQGEKLPSQSESQSGRYLVLGDISLDRHTRQVTLGDQCVRLTPTSFDYLVTLARHAPEPVRYESLVEESQGYHLTPIEAREIAVWHIHELRQALESNPHKPQLILTVRNTGYRLSINP